MTARMAHFVCDRCGNLWRAYRASECPGCKHPALWTFPDAQPARDHAARIKGRVRFS